MSKFKAGDRVLQKPAWANPDVLVISSINDEQTLATCHTEQGRILRVGEIPVDELELAPPRANDWMR
ncbi:MAG: hypothetical protein Q8R02_00105 [Hyphomonadaceae bacterium]|nr:hypothetical protein [Hyphomonadaceae bacterium]